MGTWAKGPFDNDAAADFLDELSDGPSSAIDRALRVFEKAPLSKYLDVDDGGAAWAACELVALSFGHGDAKDERVADVLEALKPKEAQRVRALSILPRLADRKTSELAGLWSEGEKKGAKSELDVALADLRARLERAATGAKTISKPKAGDVLLLAGAGKRSIVLQVVSAREVVVFEGSATTDDEALARVKSAPARRVLATAARLHGHAKARLVGNVPLRKELKGKKLYAHDSGTLESYMLATAAIGDMQSVTYEEARTYDLAEPHSEAALRAVAAGKKAIGRVRSPDAHEAEIRAEHAKEWAKSRATTTPGPFGDLARLESNVKWVEDYGVDNLIDVMHRIATGAQGYGRPSEDSERSDYADCGIVALWIGGLPMKAWPAALKGRLPPVPKPKRLAIATRAARVLASKLVTRDAALRMIWDQAPDRGEAFRRSVAELQRALG